MPRLESTFHERPRYRTAWAHLVCVNLAASVTNRTRPLQAWPLQTRDEGPLQTRDRYRRGTVTDKGPLQTRAVTDRWRGRGAAAFDSNRGAFELDQGSF